MGDDIVRAGAEGYGAFAAAAKKLQARPVFAPLQEPLHRIEITLPGAQSVPFDNIAGSWADTFGCT